MFIDVRQPRHTSGMTLIETMVAASLFSIVALALTTVFIFCLRSFESMANYATLEKENREAMNLLTREIRQATKVTGYTTSPPTLTLLNGSGHTVTYSFNTTNQTFLRSSTDGSSEVLLTNCSVINFNLYQRNIVGGSYDVFPASSSNWQATAKVLDLSWKTSKRIGGTSRVNSENVQTARIVIRKQS